MKSKRIASLVMALVMTASLSSCCDETKNAELKQSIKELQEEITRLQEERDKALAVLEENGIEVASYEEESCEDIESKETADNENLNNNDNIVDGQMGEIIYNKYLDLYVREITKSDGTKTLVDANDFNKKLLSGYTSINEPIYMEYYDPDNGGIDEYNDDKGMVQEIEMPDGTKILVDANDFSKVLLSRYVSISEPKYIFEYDPILNGGDRFKGGGMVLEVEMADGTKKLVDANDFRKLLSGYVSINDIFIPFYSRYDVPIRELEMADGSKALVSLKDFSYKLADYVSLGETFYLDKYAEIDEEKASQGYVREITLVDGTKYLVDADDFRIILASGYEHIDAYWDYKTFERCITITYPDGKKIDYTPEVCPITKLKWYEIIGCRTLTK